MKQEEKDEIIDELLNYIRMLDDLPVEGKQMYFVSEGKVVKSDLSFDLILDEGGFFITNDDEYDYYLFNDMIYFCEDNTEAY